MNAIKPHLFEAICITALVFSTTVLTLFAADVAKAVVQDSPITLTAGLSERACK